MIGSSVRTAGTNQAGTEVCTFNRTILIAMRGHGVEDKINDWAAATGPQLQCRVGVNG